MKIVIDIPAGVYGTLKFFESAFDGFEPSDIKGRLIMSVLQGKILPKGHGRLIDADETLKAMNTWDKFGFEHTGLFVRNPEDDFIKYVHYDDMVKSVKGADTIVEADKEIEE